MRQGELTFAPQRIAGRVPRPVELSRDIVIRWRCRKCGELNLDRSTRHADASVYRCVRRGRPFNYATTAKCCGVGWCFVVEPLPGGRVYDHDAGGYR